VSSRKLTDLHPLMQPLVVDFLARAELEGIDLLVTCTYRSDEEQEKLYAIGRTKPGRRVTNAPPGRSMHNFRFCGKPASLAVDVVPLRAGKPVWGTTGADLALWQKVGQLGEAAGLEWAGRWKRFREFPHFQHLDAKSVRLRVN
jgi:peptidoglycan L-alanyl-D-glutamate endopeptidase CwlK